MIGISPATENVYPKRSNPVCEKKLKDIAPDTH